MNQTGKLMFSPRTPWISLRKAFYIQAVVSIAPGLCPDLSLCCWKTTHDQFNVLWWCTVYCTTPLFLLFIPPTTPHRDFWKLGRVFLDVFLCQDKEDAMLFLCKVLKYERIKPEEEVWGEEDFCLFISYFMAASAGGKHEELLTSSCSVSLGVLWCVVWKMKDQQVSISSGGTWQGSAHCEISASHLLTGQMGAPQMLRMKQGIISWGPHKCRRTGLCVCVNAGLGVWCWHNDPLVCNYDDPNTVVLQTPSCLMPVS